MPSGGVFAPQDRKDRGVVAHDLRREAVRISAVELASLDVRVGTGYEKALALSAA